MDVQRTTDSLRGQFLIATPVIESGFFKSTVTYICEHGEAGAMGIVIKLLSLRAKLPRSNDL